MSTEPANADSVRQELERTGIDPAGIDLAWLAGIKLNAEQRIAAFRADPALADMLPAFAIWPELAAAKTEAPDGTP
jgi:hypothetical protein